MLKGGAFELTLFIHLEISKYILIMIKNVYTKMFNEKKNHEWEKTNDLYTIIIIIRLYNEILKINSSTFSLHGVLCTL